MPDSSRVALEDFAAAWQDRYPAIIKLWRAQDGRWLFAQRRLHDDWFRAGQTAQPGGPQEAVALLRRCPPALANASAGRPAPSS